jgi:hypothetical protein
MSEERKKYGDAEFIDLSTLKFPKTSPNEKYPNVKWFKEPISLVAEFNSDNAWINTYLFKELGGNISGDKVIHDFSSMSSQYQLISFMNEITIMRRGGSFLEERPQIKIAIARYKDKLLIRRDEKGIPLSYNASKNKVYLDCNIYRNLMEYFDYSIDGLWIFEPEDKILVGTKVTYEK